MEAIRLQLPPLYPPVTTGWVPKSLLLLEVNPDFPVVQSVTTVTAVGAADTRRNSILEPHTAALSLPPSSTFRIIPSCLLQYNITPHACMREAAGSSVGRVTYCPDSGNFSQCSGRKYRGSTSQRRAQGGVGLQPPKRPKANLKNKFCTYYNKYFTWFPVKPKSATEIGSRPVH
jgi:hypothetical protein